MAGLIPSNLGHGLSLYGFGLTAATRLGHLHSGCDGNSLLFLYLYMEEISNHVVLGTADELVERVKRLSLVFHQRIFLAHGTQPYSSTKVAHLGKMLSPLIVDHGQHHSPLNGAQHFGSELLLSDVVERMGLFLGLLRNTLHCASRPDSVVGHRGWEQDCQLFTDLFGVPGDRRQAGVNRKLSGLSNGVVDPFSRKRAGVFASQDQLPPGIDNLALAVHNLVIFQNVLTDFEILLFHGILGSFDGFRNHLGLNRNIVGHS